MNEFAVWVCVYTITTDAMAVCTSENIIKCTENLIELAEIALLVCVYTITTDAFAVCTPEHVIRLNEFAV